MTEHPKNGEVYIIEYNTHSPRGYTRTIAEASVMTDVDQEDAYIGLYSDYENIRHKDDDVTLLAHIDMNNLTLTVLSKENDDGEEFSTA